MQVASSRVPGAVLSCVRLVATPVDCSPTRLLCPWGFSRQESWGGLPVAPSRPPRDLPEPRDGTPSLLHGQEDSLSRSHQGSFDYQGEDSSSRFINQSDISFII